VSSVSVSIVLEIKEEKVLESKESKEKRDKFCVCDEMVELFCKADAQESVVLVVSVVCQQ